MCMWGGGGGGWGGGGEVGGQDIEASLKLIM